MTRHLAGATPAASRWSASVGTPTASTGGPSGTCSRCEPRPDRDRIAGQRARARPGPARRGALEDDGRASRDRRSSRPTATGARRTPPGARARSSRRSSGRCSTDASTSRSTAPRTCRPTRTERLVIAAYLPRADPRDALVVRADATARYARRPAARDPGRDRQPATDGIPPRPPAGPRSSIRSTATSTPACAGSTTGETDALVLACAGLDRLGLGDADRRAAGPRAPAAGAGSGRDRGPDPARRRPDARVGRGHRRRPTRIAVEAERAFLAASGGGCRAPIGALATHRRRHASSSSAGYASPDGSTTVVERRSGAVRRGAGGLAVELASDLLPATRVDGARARRRTAHAATRARARHARRRAGRRAAGRRCAAPASSPSRSRRSRSSSIRTRPSSIAPSGRLGRYRLGRGHERERRPGDPRGGRAGVAPSSARPRWAAIGRVDRRDPRGRRASRSTSSRAAQPARRWRAELPIGDRRRGPRRPGRPRRRRPRRPASSAAAPWSTTSSPTARWRRRRRRGRCCAGRWRSGAFDAVVFTSGSTVRGLRRLAAAGRPRRHARSPRSASARRRPKRRARPASGSSPVAASQDADALARDDRRGPRMPPTGDRHDARPRRAARPTPPTTSAAPDAAPAPPAAPHAGPPRARPRDAAPSVDARRAALRPAGPRRPRADRVDARRRPAVARRRRRRGGPPGRPRRRRGASCSACRRRRTPLGTGHRRTTGSSRRRSAGSARASCRS